MIQSSVSLWLVPTTRAQAMSAPDDEVDGVRSCFHAGREPTSWFCIRRSTPRQPESWHASIARSLGGIWATADGGQTWALQPSGTSADLRRLSVVDSRAIWAFGARTVLGTATGGR